MEEINIGYLMMDDYLCKADVSALVDWIVGDKIAFLTGSFGQGNDDILADLARDAWAINDRPIAQCVTRYNYRIRGYEKLVHPTFFMCFGCFRRIKIPHFIDEAWILAGFNLGADIINSCIDLKELPRWQMNDRGTLVVPNHGQIKMVQVDWRQWWINGVFQTTLWTGTATPSHKQQYNLRKRQETKQRGRIRGKR